MQYAKRNARNTKHNKMHNSSAPAGLRNQFNPTGHAADPEQSNPCFSFPYFDLLSLGGREAAIRALAARGFCALTARFLASSSG